MNTQEQKEKAWQEWWLRWPGCIAKTEFKQAFEAGYDAAMSQIGQCGCGAVIAPWETECYQCWQELNHASHDSQYPCDLETLV